MSKIIIKKRTDTAYYQSGTRKDYRHHLNSSKEFFDVWWVKDAMKDDGIDSWKVIPQEGMDDIWGITTEGKEYYYGYVIEGELEINCGNTVDDAYERAMRGIL